MALNQLKPNIISAKINQELIPMTVAVEGCYRDFEADVKKAGQSITIPQIARPTATTTTDGEPFTFSSYESLVSSSYTMYVKAQTGFGQVLDDTDDAQAIGGVMEKIATGGAEQIAQAIDVHILALAGDAKAVKDNASATKIETTNVLSIIDAAAAKLRANNVPFTTPLELIVSYRFLDLFRLAYETKDTDNSKMLEDGVAAIYHGIKIKASNNVLTASAGAEDLMIMRTNRAIAFVQQVNKIETIRHPYQMGDVVRGLSLYQADIVQPKEMIVINAKYA